MRHFLYPDEYLPSAYQIDYEGLYQKGFRGDRKSTRLNSSHIH